MKNLLLSLSKIEKEIVNCEKESQVQKELLRKREIIETMIYIIMKNDQK